MDSNWARHEARTREESRRKWKHDTETYHGCLEKRDPKESILFQDAEINASVQALMRGAIPLGTLLIPLEEYLTNVQGLLQENMYSIFK